MNTFLTALRILFEQLRLWRETQKRDKKTAQILWVIESSQHTPSLHINPSPDSVMLASPISGGSRAINGGSELASLISQINISLIRIRPGNLRAINAHPGNSDFSGDQKPPRHWATVTVFWRPGNEPRPRCGSRPEVFETRASNEYTPY